MIDPHGRVKNVSFHGGLGKIIKVKHQNERVPKSESNCGVMVCKENGRETVHGRESGQNQGGKKKSCLLQCLPKASPDITSVTFTQS